MESGAANFYNWGKDEAESYISGEEGTEYYTAEEAGAKDCDSENSDKEATQKDCGMKKSDKDATKKHCRVKKSEEDPTQNDCRAKKSDEGPTEKHCRVKKSDEDPTQKHCRVKKSDQKRERYSSRDRRIGRDINRQPDCTARRPEQHKDTTVHFNSGSWFPDLTADSHATAPNHYDLSGTEQTYETNERTRIGVEERSPLDVTDADFQKEENKENQVVINMQLTLFDIVEKGRIFVDMHGELLRVPLENSVRDGREIVFLFRGKSICFLIKEVRTIIRNHSRTIWLTYDRNKSHLTIAAYSATISHIVRQSTWAKHFAVGDVSYTCLTKMTVDWYVVKDYQTRYGQSQFGNVGCPN